eukprot:6917-Eustigmatos_ZCMA.PRE.1
MAASMSATWTSTSPQRQRCASSKHIPYYRSGVNICFVGSNDAEGVLAVVQGAWICYTTTPTSMPDPEACEHRTLNGAVLSWTTIGASPPDYPLLTTLPCFICA